MSISGEKYTWDEDNVNAVKAEGAVYALYEGGVLIYYWKY